MAKTQILESGMSMLWKIPKGKINPKTIKYVPKSKPDEFIKNSSNQSADSGMVQLFDILSRNIVKPKIIKSLLLDFNVKKTNLVRNLEDILDKELLNAIKSSKTAEELADIIERYQAQLLNNVGKSKDILIKSSAKDKEQLIQNYMNDYYRFTDYVYRIQKGMVDKTINPEVLKIEKILKEKYGFNFVALGDNIKQAKDILKACEIWETAGEKIPKDIILTETMPVAFAQGQCLHTSNGNTCILIAKNPNAMAKIFNFHEKLHDKLANLFKSSKTRLKSTTSKYHKYIHEFSHSIQSKQIIENRLTIPPEYESIAKNVSVYGNGSLEELFAELKTKSILTPNKMSKNEWNLLNYIQ